VKGNTIEALKGGLIVSCQAYPGEPMRVPLIMAAVAEAVVDGGAVAVRAQGLADIERIARCVQVPVVGLVKVGDSGVFITPTVADCAAVADAGAEIVAFDGTVRARPDGSDLAECVTAIHEHGSLALADCGSVEDARASVVAGADCLATTLAGYTGCRTRTDGPDFKLLSEMVALSPVPVVAEGRIRTPADAARCIELGAHAVVVGTAITHPTSITRRFAEELARIPARGCSAEVPARTEGGRTE